MSLQLGRFRNSLDLCVRHESLGRVSLGKQVDHDTCRGDMSPLVGCSPGDVSDLGIVWVEGTSKKWLGTGGRKGVGASSADQCQRGLACQP